VRAGIPIHAKGYTYNVADLIITKLTRLPAQTQTALQLACLGNIAQVSQTVSSEIVPEKLFDTVMRKAMEHARAERGLLIFPRGDELWIEAESRTRGNDVIVSPGDATAAAIPESILRYVMRTHESVILDDASSTNPGSRRYRVREKDYPRQFRIPAQFGRNIGSIWRPISLYELERYCNRAPRLNRCNNPRCAV
jgi:hypothetical protein